VNFDTDNINVEDILGSIFGHGAGRQAAPMRGADLQVSVNVALTEAYRGVTKELRVQNKTYRVNIPAGAKDGSRIRFRGEGEPGPGGPRGDLVFVVQVTPDPRFERMGDDLLSTRHVDFPTAALGGSVQVETMTGKVNLKIPAGTQSDSVIRMRGKGMPKTGGHGHGDQLVRIVVDVPTQLGPAQKALLEQLRETL
jgi:DnaJ-class molecular chaperone